MRATDGNTSRSENGTSSWGNAVWRNLAMPALPPSRRERALRAAETRAAGFAGRVLGPAVEPLLLAARSR